MAKRTAKPRSAGKAPNIRELRTKIDRLDKEIVRLLNQRAAFACKIGKLKTDSGLEVFSPAREDEVVAKVLAANSGPLDERCIRGIFRELMSGSRALQRVLRVAYLGPEYSFSHLAALERFGESVELVPTNTIQAVFEAVNRGQVNFGLVPIENSTDGRISDTLEMFTRLPLKICSEVRLRVHHNLLSKCAQSEIRRVYSKPQALAQCRTWLSKNVAQAQLIDVTSTSTAAELARNDPHTGAVASRQAALHYDLDIVASNIEDSPNNTTRFAVIGEHEGSRTGNDKTAVMIQIDNRPGVLADTLAAFKKNRVNMTWIESFPVRDVAQEYVFFIDFEGHPSEARCKRTLAALQRRCSRLVVLGSYPKSDCYES